MDSSSIKPLMWLLFLQCNSTIHINANRLPCEEKLLSGGGVVFIEAHKKDEHCFCCAFIVLIRIIINYVRKDTFYVKQHRNASHFDFINQGG